MSDYFCQFCNEMRDEEHISVCPTCKGKLHANSKEQVCATCGRSFKLKTKPKETPKVKEVLQEDLHAPEKALMTIQE